MTDDSSPNSSASDLEELKARLAELQANRPKLKDPSPWLHRTLWAAAVPCYVLGFVESLEWVAVAVALWLFAMPSAEAYGKFARERRRAAGKAAIEAWEKEFRHQYAVRQFERTITPDWMR